jgi:hypothetical protein
MMVNKHCACGDCNSDSRYAHKEHMKNVSFVNFPKFKSQPEKCLAWVEACYREDFKVENVNKDTYICTKHFVGGQGLTDMHPDNLSLSVV